MTQGIKHKSEYEQQLEKRGSIQQKIDYELKDKKISDREIKRALKNARRNNNQREILAD